MYSIATAVAFLGPGYLWNHPDLSQKTKEKIAYHNGKECFQLGRPASTPAARKANRDNNARCKTYCSRFESLRVRPEPGEGVTRAVLETIEHLPFY